MGNAEFMFQADKVLMCGRRFRMEVCVNGKMCKCANVQMGNAEFVFLAMVRGSRNFICYIIKCGLANGKCRVHVSGG